MASESRALLTVKDLRKNFGGVKALDGVTFSLAEGELAGLIGPNGSGKTTAFNLLTGVLKPSSGSIRFRGEAVAGNPPERNARLGMARTFQNIRLFRELPVIDNVMVGVHMRHGPGFVPTVLRLPSAQKAERDIRERAMAALEVLGLARRAKEIVGSLPYGDQRKVEFARALATEPTAGMNPQETADLGETIRRLHGELGITTLLVEHDMKMVMGLCRHIVVVNQGVVLASGAPEVIQSNPKVIEAYLGRRRKGADAAA